MEEASVMSKEPVKRWGWAWVGSSLLAALLAAGCEASQPGDCEETLTCIPPEFELRQDCVWVNRETGLLWQDSPRLDANGTWVWPDGTPTGQQDFDCNINANVPLPKPRAKSPEAGTVPGAGDCTVQGCAKGFVCDPGKGLCVACLDDTHCADPTPVCQTSRQQCVECRDSAGCAKNPGLPICNVGAGTCTAQCAKNAECQGGQLCNVAEQACVACLSDDNCEGNAQCDLTSHTCVQCTDDAGCAGSSSPYCLQSSNTCVACASDADCSGTPTPACATELGQCVGCVDNTHCAPQGPGSARCDLATRTCVGCKTNADCSGGYCRDDGHCVACLSDGECEVGQRCDIAPGSPRTGQCVQCTGSVDCTDPARPRCETNTNFANYGNCSICRNNDDCTGIRNASGVEQPVCGSKGRCVACESAFECDSPEAAVCGAEGQCQPCSRDADCRHLRGLNACNAGQCVACTNDSHCTSPARARCDTATNRCEPCLADAQCTGVSNSSGPLAICATEGSQLGQCVQCTGANAGACGGAVCDSLANRCTTLAPGSAILCGECVSDAHCGAGYTCMFQVFQPQGDVPIGHVCLPTLGGDFCNAPFLPNLARQNIDGTVVSFCDLARTTCPAFLDYKSDTPCDEGSGGATCGALGVNDSACVISAAGGFECSMGCEVNPVREDADGCTGFEECRGGVCQQRRN